MKPADIQIGYLMVSTPAPNVYLGGLMVTDGRGLPVEFRYTEPVQPSRIQQVLYGQVLSAYIKREMILETLLKNVESRFRCLLVEDEHLSGSIARGVPMIRIAATKASPIGAIGKTQEIAPGEILLQVSAEGSPVRLRLDSPKNDAPTKNETTPKNEAPAPESDESVTALTSLLLEAGQGMDLVEPLRRIEKALEIICQEAGISAAAPSGR